MSGGTKGPARGTTGPARGKNTARSGLKKRAGRLSVEAPVRPMRVAARVEIPSRKAGETVERGA